MKLHNNTAFAFTGSGRNYDQEGAKHFLSILCNVMSRECPPKIESKSSENKEWANIQCAINKS